MNQRFRISPILILLLLAAWALLTIQIGAAWFGHQDANGAWISLAVRSYQRHGFLALGGIVDIQTSPVGAVLPYQHHPPLMVWMMALPVLAAGYDEALLRFVAAACTLISIVALYVLARRLAGGRFALWSAVFYAFTPMIAYFGRMPDHEAPALMFSLLFAAVLVGWLRRPSRGQWWALVILTVLAAWTAWGALIVIGALLAAALITTRRGARQYTALILLGGIALASVVVMLGYFVLVFPDALSDLMNAFIWRTSTSTLEPGAVNFTWGEYGLRIVVRLVTLYTPTVLALAIIGAFVTLRRRGILSAFILALLAAGAAYILLFRNASFIHDYYLMYLAPTLALLAGGAAALLTRRRARWLRPLVAALAICTLPATAFYLAEIYRASDATEGLAFADAVRANTAPGDLILSNLPSIGYALEFYADRAIQWDVPPAAALEAAADGGAVDYLYCEEGTPPPESLLRLASVTINPQCRLARLR